ncbi:MAG TPA: CDP-alcohol phosphatidyltransferase family protein [Allosphingosinicella sp.]|nr:CDP-alcohol phosphatidyltransferase family protein [Allosphingosinicella sp.]
MGRGKTLDAVAAFESAAAAQRPIAGVAAAARAVRGLADEGAASVTLRIGDGAALDAATRADIERLRGPTLVLVETGSGPAAVLPSAWEVVRRTGKPGDGLVSRWLNRPISQRITLLVLAIPGIRPVHVTIVNALLAVPMFLCLLFGGQSGLIAGAILFQLASILDGVDGEMARASHRASREGAAMDSAVDMATNFLFVLGLTLHLAIRDEDLIGWIGALAILQLIVGNLLIARRVRAQGAPLGFDLYKRRSGRIGGIVDLVYWAVQLLTGRDCFAFLFMVLTVVGLERVALAIFAGVGTIWFFYVLLRSLLAGARPIRPLA